MPGMLLMVVGPSGAGKDTLLTGARAALDGSRFVFPRRIITRPEDAGGEDHVAVSLDAFERQMAHGGFALSWSAHGHWYAIPGSISDDLAAGRHVVVNVSRSVIGEARRNFAPIGVVLVSVSRDTLAARLAARGREDEGEVAQRLERASAHEVAGDDVIQVTNDGTVDDGVSRLVAALEALTGT